MSARPRAAARCDLPTRATQRNGAGFPSPEETIRYTFFSCGRKGGGVDTLVLHGQRRRIPLHSPERRQVDADANVDDAARGGCMRYPSKLRSIGVQKTVGGVEQAMDSVEPRLMWLFQRTKVVRGRSTPSSRRRRAPTDRVARGIRPAGRRPQDWAAYSRIRLESINTIVSVVDVPFGSRFSGISGREMLSIGGHVPGMIRRRTRTGRTRRRMASESSGGSIIVVHVRAISYDRRS